MSTSTTVARVLDSLRRESEGSGDGRGSGVGDGDGEGSGNFRVCVPADWGQGRTIFGGMQAALAVRAMRAVTTGARDLPLRSLQVTFVGPLPGEKDVRVRAAELRVGGAATHARCDLLHLGQVACTAVAIFGATRRSRISLDIPRPAVGVDPETLPDMPEVPGVTPAFARHLQFRWAAGTPPFTGSREPRTAIFARLRERDATPEEALIVLADSVPPPALSMMDAPTPVSSLNWTLELLGDPERLARDDWALIGTEVRAGADGYLSQTSVLWGPSGHAFSVSHQTVAIFG